MWRPSDSPSPSAPPAGSSAAASTPGREDKDRFEGCSTYSHIISSSCADEQVSYFFIGLQHLNKREKCLVACEYATSFSIIIFSILLAL